MLVLLKSALLLIALGYAPAVAVEYFGQAVAVGNGWVAVGAPFQNGGGVLVYANGKRERIPNPGGEVGDWFGCSLAVAGETLVVGSRGADRNKGAVFTYAREGGAWKLQQKLPASGILEDFGIAVTASGDTIAAGATGADRAKGAVYIFVREGAQWKLQQRFSASNGADADEFGMAVALERDTLVVGAGHKRQVADDRGTTNTGAAYVFERKGTAWQELARLLSPGGKPSFEFGSAVGVSGGTVIIGEHRRGNEPGGAHVFERSGNVWNWKQVLRPRDNTSSDAFGLGIAMEGATLVVGARRKDSELGATYVYTGKGADWTEAAKLVAPDRGAEDRSLNSPQRFGQAVAVHGDTIAVGAPEREKQTGAAYSFTKSGGKWAAGSSLAR